MERLTARNERFPDETYYPYCFREDTCRGEGMSDKCDMCEPEQIRKLKDRDTAKAPEEIQDAFGDTRLICPNCRNSVINYFNRSRPPQFCMICGQRLKFGE